MHALLESSQILGGKDIKPPEMTTKLIAPSVDQDDTQDISRIPKKYHIIRSFPIFPKDFADQGYRVYNNNGTWNVVLWPSANPDSRQDVQYLSDAVRLMLDELQGDTCARVDPTQMQDVQKAKTNAAHMIQLFEKRCSLLKIALDEITRQVSAHCTERGALLSFLIDDFMNAFKEIPKQYNSALKVMKKEVDQLRVSLDAKSMELDSQAKDLNEQISLMMLERRMEKEWHGQLEEQLKKWKQQVDTYKKKAQDQIKLEREMLEHQISGLRDVVADLRLENDALKEQLQFQRSEMLKSEKKYAEFEQQIQTMNKKNEKLQMQISKGGMTSSRAKSPTSSRVDSGENNQPGPEASLVDESKLKQLIEEFPKQKEMPLLTHREITQVVFGLFDQLFNNPNSFAPLDDFYAQRLLITEETPQAAADTARGFLLSLNHSEDVFTLASLTNDLLRRKFNDSIFRILIQFYGFFKAQPFQFNTVIDHNTDVPIIPVALANNLTQSMFTTVLGDDGVKDVNEQIKAVQIEERGKPPMIPIVNVFDLMIRKIVDHFNQKCTETLNNFSRHYTRYQKTINQRIPTDDPTIQRMDWRTFRDFMKPIRQELTMQELERLFFDCTHFSDSIASITSDAFDTMCVTRQIYINKIKVPGSGKRLRFVPNEMLSVIDSAWKNSLRSSVKKAITELSKSDQAQNAVVTLRALDQKLEETLKNTSAGPFCMQLLHEAASIIGSEAVSIASSLPIDKCLSIMERQITVLNTDSAK
ncbi:hypothetical protein TRFO_29260 [Tritrichomonas foetus]|uniref:Uncharacterized protein n=1 Tax=Tritrichomonas foetus TaxID=1144522 RepID=A0A1J4K1I7_9EUKA|nr:hypothetical protein TRFO_29260 [Tritrichomonas foetus]|eukprot:OHT03341.1 hypothetical protein TRFO_29260 [Tritrichomonas foetus]